MLVHGTFLKEKEQFITVKDRVLDEILDEISSWLSSRKSCQGMLGSKVKIMTKE